jgi:non-ribosomal peptide synthetase component F
MCQWIWSGQLAGFKRLALEASAVKIVALPSKELDSSSAWEAPRFENQPRLAYVMFTSGSTGAPKGVLINQSSILRLTTQAKYLRLDVHTRMLQAAPYGFDASTLEIWGPLLNGGCCVLHSEDIPSARGLARTITGLNVNTAWLTSSLFNSVVDVASSWTRSTRDRRRGFERTSCATGPGSIAEVAAYQWLWSD